MHISALFNKKWMVIIVIATVLFCNSSCQKHETKKTTFPLTSEEYTSLEKFFRYFLLSESAIFTLIGSKPLTEVTIIYSKENSGYLNPKEASGHFFIINQDNAAEMAWYKTLPKDCTIKLVREKDDIYNHTDLWDFWEKISPRFSISKKFLLVKKERPLADVQAFDPSYEKIYDILFIDIFKTALVLQENYPLFKQAVGYDFDPVSITLEAANPSSPFWNAINSPAYSHLWGLLYGFGKQNTFSYYWKWRYFPYSTLSATETAFAKSLKNQPFKRDFAMKFSITDFPIPVFASFSNPDPVVLKYEQERAKIQKEYRGKDFVQHTLHLLTTES